MDKFKKEGLNLKPLNSKDRECINKSLNDKELNDYIIGNKSWLRNIDTLAIYPIEYRAYKEK